jgi:hypothetical protein
MSPQIGGKIDYVKTASELLSVGWNPYACRYRCDSGNAEDEDLHL